MHFFLECSKEMYSADNEILHSKFVCQNIMNTK